MSTLGSRLEGGMPKFDEAQGPNYSLGHSDEELDRLSVQARLIEPITRRFLVEGGIAEGMRVLDVGSGVGDVAFLVADLVGPKGAVVGTDRAGRALSVARRRASARSLENVSFLEGDPATMAFDAPFDAVVGRYFLMFQKDPVALLRGVAAHVGAGGSVVFHEPFRAGIRSFPPIPSYDDGWELANETFRQTGADPTMGIKLHATFLEAGLRSPTLRMESLIAGGDDCLDHVHFEMDLVKTLLPEAVRIGIANADEINVETLPERVATELEASHGVIVGRSEVGAWSRVVER
jgi:SAM-dependent methyltransferase